MRWFLRATMAVAGAYMLAITWLAPDLAPGWLRHVANGLHGLLPVWFTAGDASAATLARQQVGAAGIIGLIAIPIATTSYAMRWSGELAKRYATWRTTSCRLRFSGCRVTLITAFAVAGLGWVQGLDVLWWLAGIVGVEAAAELLIRLLTARRGRLRLAARLFGRGARSRAFMGALAIAALLAVWSSWDHAASGLQPVRPRTDPNVIAAAAEAERAYRAARERCRQRSRPHPPPVADRAPVRGGCRRGVAPACVPITAP